MVGYRINTLAFNGGAAEQPTLFKVVPEAATPEEEEKVKRYEKDHTVKPVKTDGGGVVHNVTHT